MLSSLLIAMAVSCPAGPQGAAPTCAAYCASITSHCTGGSAQYASEQACFELCTAEGLGWAVGTLADQTGNTLGCRSYHADAAANDDHCAHAGPTGGGACGDYCDVYCDAALANCTEANQLFADAASCHAACARFPVAGDVNDRDGNTVQCRLYHLGAARAEPAVHCPHGGPSGANVCGTMCEVYCATMEAACSAEYADAAECANTCGGFPDTGDLDDTTGDTVQCRLLHAVIADDDAHCDYASAESTADTCR